jgi:hypothetical protein
MGEFIDYCTWETLTSWTSGRMGQEKPHGLYCLVNGGGPKKSGTDGTRETAWFVLVSEWWWMVD